jgi:hypothetical protein
LRNAFDELALEAGVGTETLRDQLADAADARRGKVWAADNAKAKAVHGFLHDLELRDAGDVQGEILGQRNAGHELPDAVTT